MWGKNILVTLGILLLGILLMLGYIREGGSGRTKAGDTGWSRKTKDNTYSK